MLISKKRKEENSNISGQKKVFRKLHCPFEKELWEA